MFHGPDLTSRRGALPLMMALTLVGALAGAPASARAGGVLDQVWVGQAAHDYTDIGAGKEAGSTDTWLELDSARPHALRFLGAPRLNLVVALNSRGQTNAGSIGFVWDHQLSGRLYGSVDLGIGLTDGVTAPPAGPAHDEVSRHRLLLGSKALFREAVGLDWRVSRHWAIGVEVSHMSNGSILSGGYNEGVNDVGLRVGYRFR